MADGRVWISDLESSTEAGSQFEFEISAYDVGDGSGEWVDFTVTWDPYRGRTTNGTIYATDEVTTETISATSSLSEGGEFSPVISPQSSTDDIIIEYADGDGLIEGVGLRDAIDDWQDGSISTDLYRGVMDGWFSSDTIEIQGQAQYTIDSVNGPSDGPYHAGQIVSWEYDIENVGQGEGTSEIEVRLDHPDATMIDGFRRFQASFAIDPGNTDTVHIEHELTEGDISSLEDAEDDWGDAGGEIGYAHQIVSIFNLTPPSISGTFGYEPGPAPSHGIYSVEESGDAMVGEPFEWDVDIINSGDDTLTEPLKLFINDEAVLTTEAIRVDPNQTETDVVQWIPSVNYAGSTDWELELDNTTASGSIYVDSAPEPDIRLAIDSINNPTVNGDITVTGHAENDTNDWITNETIRLFVGGSEVDDVDLSMSPQNHESWELTYPADGSNAEVGENFIQVDSADTPGVVRDGTVTIDGLPGYQIVTVDHPSEANPGEWITFEAEIENTGTDDSGRDLVLDWGSTDASNDEIRRASVDPGESKTLRFKHLPEASDVGSTVDFSVGTPTDTYSSSIDVVEPEFNPQASISVQRIDHPVNEGDPVTVTVTVESETIGSFEDTLRLEVNGVEVDSDEVDQRILSDHTVHRLTWEDTMGEANDINTALISFDDDDAFTPTEIDLVPVSEFRLETISAPDEIEMHGTGEWTVDVTNIGTADGSAELELDFHDLDITRRTGVGGLSTETVTLLVTPYEQHIGNERWRLAVDDSSRQGWTEVIEVDADYDVYVHEIDSDHTPIGETVDIQAQVYNRSTIDGDQTVELTLDGITVDGTPVTLPPGNRGTTTLTWEPSFEHEGTNTLYIESSTDEAPATVTATDDPIVAMSSPVPSTGPFAEIVKENGHTENPTALDGVKRLPKVNDYSRVEVPVRRREKWHDDAYDDAEMYAFHDGERQPVERLDHRRVESERTILEGRGGIDLENRVIEEVEIEPVHEVARRLIGENSDLIADVDPPAADTSHFDVDAAASEIEFRQMFGEFADDMPFEYTESGGIRPLRTCWAAEAHEHHTGESDSVEDSQFSSGEAARLRDRSDRLTLEFENEYTIKDPEFVSRNFTADGVDAEIYLDYERHHFLSYQTDELAWRTQPLEEIDEIPPGEHRIEVRVTDEVRSGDRHIDVFGIRDGRYRYDEPNDVNQYGVLNGPGYYPNLIRLETREYAMPLAIDSIGIDVAVNDADGAGRIGFRENGVENYSLGWWELSTPSFEVEYDKLEALAQAFVEIGARGDLDDRDEFPGQGYEAQELEGVDIEAELDETPVLINWSFDGRLKDALDEIADVGNYIYEVQSYRDRVSLAMAQIESRESTVDPDIIDYESDRQTEDVVDRAIIYGSASRLTRQTVTVNTGEWVDLPFSDARIVEGRETIYDPEDDEEEYVHREDYKMRYTSEDGVPKLKALPDGAISDGSDVHIDADVKPRGVYIADDVDESNEPKTVTQDMPGLSTTQMCDQVARYLVRETGEAVHEITIEVGHDNVEWSVIEAITATDLPGEGPYQTRKIANHNDRSVIQLSSRQMLDEMIATIQSRSQSNAKRV